MKLLQAVGVLRNAGVSDVVVSESKKNGSSTGVLLVNIDGIIMCHQDVIEMAQFHQRKAAINGLRDLLAIVAWGAELQAEVEEAVSKFFEAQQVVWLYLEEKSAQLGPIEDVTNSNSDPEEYYPFVGTEDVPATHKEEVVNPIEAVEIITELKQEIAKRARARVIEFKAKGRTFVRVVRKADAAAFDDLKWDIRAWVATPDIPRVKVDAVMRLIIPTLKVRPGFVYVNI